MILHPPVLALIVAALISAGFVGWASLFAIRLLRHWNLASGSQTQIDLEKGAYLVAVILRFVMASELAALVLFVFNADRMASMFVGAMCAVGAFNASVYGFPALGVKIALFFGAGLWLALDVVDGQGRDYPLTRLKYGALLALAPLAFADAGLTLAYFLDLKADTLTSCCGKLFSAEKPTIAAEMAGLNPKVALLLLAAASIVVLGVAAAAQRLPRAHGLYGVMSVVFFGVALAAVVSAISLYVYEHPHHHCPFCLLKREYHYFGFLLYAFLFAGTALGLAAGVIGSIPTPASLQMIAPRAARKLLTGSIIGFALFCAASAWAVVSSKLVLM